MRSNERMIIPKSVVQRYSRNINFHISIEFFFIEEIKPIIIWISKLDYDLIEEEAIHCEKVLLGIPSDPNRTKIEAPNNSRRIGKKRKSIVEIKKEVIEQEGRVQTGIAQHDCEYMRHPWCKH
jgi:hypothetical protein